MESLRQCQVVVEAVLSQHGHSEFKAWHCPEEPDNLDFEIQPGVLAPTHRLGGASPQFQLELA